MLYKVISGYRVRLGYRGTGYRYRVYISNTIFKTYDLSFEFTYDLSKNNGVVPSNHLAIPSELFFESVSTDQGINIPAYY